MSITICDTHLARTVRYLSLTFEPVYSATPFGFGYFSCCKHSFTRFIINSECKGNSYEKTINAVNAYACSYGLDTGIDCRNIQY